MRQLLSLVLVVAGLVSAPAFASVELVALPIKDIQHNRQGNSIQVEVTIDFQACKYNFKGLYLEPIAAGQGQSRFHVVALASERPGNDCAANSEPTTRNEALVLQSVSSDRYDFVK